jgi:hypothetical protein
MTNMRKKTVGLADPAKPAHSTRATRLIRSRGAALRLSTLIGGIAMALGNLA